MKPKIPVFDTVGHGFYFALTRYFSLLRITWVPALLAGIILIAEFTTLVMADRGLIHATKLVSYISLFFWIPAYVLLAIPAVAAYRMAVFGRPAPRGISYFRLGGTELQFMAAQLVTTVYMMVYVVLSLAVVVPLALLVYSFIAPAEVTALTAAIGVKTFSLADAVTLRMRIGAVALATLLAITAFGPILFSMVQPVVVAERRIGVWRSLSLVWFGNAIRLALAWAIVGISFTFLSVVAVALLKQFGPYILQMVMPDLRASDIARRVISWSFLTLLPTLLVVVLLLGVTAGVNGYAYRILAARPKDSPK